MALTFAKKRALHHALLDGHLLRHGESWLCTSPKRHDCFYQSNTIIALFNDGQLAQREVDGVKVFKCTEAGLAALPEHWRDAALRQMPEGAIAEGKL